MRTGGDTKTRTSRRTLALPRRASTPFASTAPAKPAPKSRRASSEPTRDLVFTTWTGGPLDEANVRRDFRRIATAAGLDAADWTPRELRHSVVSLLSDEGVPVEQIARLVGHAGGSTVTETVYRKQLRPIIDDGAIVMDRIFDTRRLVTQRASEKPNGPVQNSVRSS